MNIIEYGDQELMAMDVANVLAGELRVALSHQDRATFVVSGGETPGPVYDALCAADLDWARVDVLLSDERWVPEVHVRSNTRMLRERLLVNRAAAAMYHPLYARAERPEDVLAELEAGIAPLLPISVCLLGMGADMHTASIFPDGDNVKLALKKKKAPILVPMRVDSQQDVRVTLSARVLNDALNTHILITGRPKRNAIDAARYKKRVKAPIKAVLAGATVHWAL
jgi:6-phosphogluconolactonase